MSTIKDIAKEAGVGAITVSRVINGKDYVKADTKAKVMAAIKKLDYKPNLSARRLVMKVQKSNLIGIITPYLTHAFYYELMKGIQDYVLEKDMNITLFIKGNHPEQALQNALKEDLAGLLILSNPMTEKEEEQLNMNRLPYVYIDYLQQGRNSVSSDNYLGGELVGNYLLQKKCKKIAYIGENSYSQQQVTRLDGFKSYLESQGVQANYYYSDWSGKKIPNLTRKAIEVDGCDGIFFYTDSYMYKALPYLTSLKKQPIFIGYDNLESTSNLKIPTVDQRAIKMGYRGAEILDNMINSGISTVSEVIKPIIIE